MWSDRGPRTLAHTLDRDMADMTGDITENETVEQIEASLRRRDEALAWARETVTRSARDRQPMTNDNVSPMAELDHSRGERSRAARDHRGRGGGRRDAGQGAEACRRRAREDAAEFQAELAKLRIELLESQLAEARGVKRLKVVPPPEQLIG